MKIFIAGDYCPRGRLETIIAKGDHEFIFSDVRKLTSDADYSLVNLECPVRTVEAKPIIKNGPNLCCTPASIDSLAWAGFNGVTLANNHILDFGNEGLNESIRICKERNIETMGAGNDITEASRIFFKNIKNQRFAIINCCEHEFSIATEISPGCNPLNPVKQFQSIQDAKNNADKVLVIVHGGHEHYQLPSPRMQETYRFFIDAGADAVVNHHQHCYSGYEIYKGKPIFYGLGNFCFDSFGIATKNWVEGYAITIDFSSEDPSFKLHPYKQCDVEPRVSILSNDAFDREINELNRIITNPAELKSYIDRYFIESAGSYGNIFEPLYNRYYLGAKHRGWLPSFISRKRKLVAMNYILCESHQDKLKWWLEREYNLM